MMINRKLSIKGIVLVVHVTLVKPNVTPIMYKIDGMDKIDEMNLIIQLKSSEPSKYLLNNINHYFTWAVNSNAPKYIEIKKNLETSCNALCKPDFNNKRTLKNHFYLEMVSYRTINDIMQTPEKMAYFRLFSLLY